MGLDKESIKRRVSRIELDIDHMNQMIDENLKLNEAGDRIGQNGQESETQIDTKQQLDNGIDAGEELPRENSVQNSATSEYSDMGETNGSIPRGNSLQGLSERGGDSYDMHGTRSEISNDEYYGWSEDQQEEQSEQGYATGQSEADTEGEDERDVETNPDPEETFHASTDGEPSETTNDYNMPKNYIESNDEWEDEAEDVELDNATPQIPQTATLPEQETPKPINHEIQPQSEEQKDDQEAPLPDFYPQKKTETHENEYPSEEVQDSTQEVTNISRGVDSRGVEFLEGHEDESIEYSYEPAQKEQEDTHTGEREHESGPAHRDASNDNRIYTPDYAQNDVEQTEVSQNVSDKKHRDSLYDMYDDHQDLPQNNFEEHGKSASELVYDPPKEKSPVGPYHINPPQNDPFDYSYETFETAPPHTANTSQESNDNNHFGIDKSFTPNRSISGSADTEDSIVIPKNNNQRPATTSNTPVASRRPTNPFRVVSVGVPGPDGRTSRKTSAGTFTSYKDSSADGPAILQKKLDYLTKRCTKLQREIDYLTKMNSSSSLPIEDSRKLSRAIAKLQEYLDRKNKEKYDVGVLLSRQLRREIDRGENGQFWIGTK